MAIFVKSADGMATEEVASNSKANAALGLGIAGLGLAALNGGLGLFGLGGVNAAARTAVAAEAITDGMCVVGKDQYYQERIQDIKDNNLAFRAVASDICDLRAQIAVNSTANSYQNRITEIGFANVDNRFTTEGVINDLNRQLAICEATKNVVKGNVYLSPSALADNYIAPTRVLDSHEAREYLPGRKFVGYGAYDPACAPCAPCGGQFY